MTLHRPANVDGKHQLLRMVHAVAEGTIGLPAHPRTANSLRKPEGQIPDWRYVDPHAKLPGKPVLPQETAFRIIAYDEVATAGMKRLRG